MTDDYLAELIQKYAERTASEEETRRLFEWYQSQAINEVQWPATSLGEKKEVYDRMLQRLKDELVRKKAKLIPINWLKIAAAVILVIGIGLLIFQRAKPVSSPYITLINPAGTIQRLRLPDSSEVWLNASTTLRYRISFMENRELELDGEAYFEVTPDATHPFSIKAGGVQTTVVGTSFNIKAYKPENSTTISVVNGSVRITNESKILAVLKPSMQLQFDRQRQVGTTTIVDTSSVVAWKRGRLQFNGESLAVIASVLERWYKVKMLFNDPAIGKCRFYMGFDNSVSLEKMLSTMAEVTGMQHSLDKNTNTITFYGKGCP